MLRLSSDDLTLAIDALDRDRWYQYITEKNHVRILDVTLPYGPITLERRNAEKPIETISSEMIARLAGAMLPGIPVNVDRVLAGSYNTRSALEAFLAHTPHIFHCKPGRIDTFTGAIKPGHKHIVWLPSETHALGELEEFETNQAISEIAASSAVYENITNVPGISTEDIDVKRRHTQIQIALVEIGISLGYKSWVAREDQSIVYGDKPLREREGIVRSLPSETMLTINDKAATKAESIDCIWFRNKTRIPAIMEIEHSTGVYSGLNRMLTFYNAGADGISTNYVIVAPDHLRAQVFDKASQPQFDVLKPHYMPYSAVEEFYALVQRHKLAGTNDDFLRTFMEPINISRQ